MKFFDTFFKQNEPQPEIIRKNEDEHQGKSVYLTEDVTFGSDEIILYTHLDMNGNFTGSFWAYSVCEK